MKRLLNFKSRKSYVFLIILFISIGFAALTANLSFNGLANFGSGKWDVHFENVKVDSNSVTADTPIINEAGDTVDFSAVLENSGDYYSFTVDVVNNGTKDAMIKSFDLSVLNGSTKVPLPEYAEYFVTYADGTAVANNHLLPKESTQTFLIKIKYKDDADITIIDEEGEGYYFRFEVKYVTADDSAIPVVTPICIRATELHTALCSRSANGCKKSGWSVGSSQNTDTITYGNLGTNGELNFGDAFDCDVVGNGNYNERFYYVSTDENNNGVLIYYKNVSTVHRYSHKDDGGLDGPYKSLQYLPDNSETSWPNVSLSNENRTIINENREEIYFTDQKINNPFVYKNKTARLLSLQDFDPIYGNAHFNGIVNSKVYQLNGVSDAFLLEGTAFESESNHQGYWLENIMSTKGNYDAPNAASINGINNQITIDGGYTNNKYGTRPVIEVPIRYIQY